MPETTEVGIRIPEVPEKLVAIIQARMGSKRLPKKAMLKLGKLTSLELCVRGVQTVGLLDKHALETIVVATTTLKDDDIIEKWCKSHKIDCFRGSANNVLDRYYQCAVKYDADWILRITADCPLICPEMIYGLLNKKCGAPMVRKPYQALGFNLFKIPSGWDAELFSMELLKIEWEKGTYKEHVSTGMRGRFEDNFDYGTDFRFHDIPSFELNTESDYNFLKEYMKLRYGC
jgi:spore coat polysaccharide biosynthesis protein SpsF